MKIGIVNYSIGNVGSVYSAFKFYKYDTLLIDKPKALSDVNIIVLAGVGNFPTAISRLKELNLWDAINEEVLNKKKPVLGICLGMQLFADISYENGENKGFGWIKGKVVRMDSQSVRVPHIGWDEVKSSDDKLFKGMRYNCFYFMHSYHFVLEDKDANIATTYYGNLKICTAVKKDNIIGVQFHPEKSQGDGLRFLKNTVEAML